MAYIGDFYSFKEIFGCVDSNIQKVCEFLESCLSGAYKKGDFKAQKRVELGNGIFAILQTYALKPKSKAFFETHRKYVDFQLTIKGAECFVVGDFRHFKIKQNYDINKDLIIYKADLGAQKIISFGANLCIFMPCDVHAGGLKHKEIKNKNVYKVVVKFPFELLKFHFDKVGK